MKRVIVLGLAATALAGCDKLPFGHLQSPQRKPGYWEQTLVADVSPTPIVTKWCFDAAADRRMPILPRPPRARASGGPNPCASFNTSKNGDTYVVDAVCGFGAVKIIRHAVLSGDFASHYTVASTIDVTGAQDAARNGHHVTTLTAVYKGADCPSELQPGQMERPDGEVVDMAQLRGGAGGPGAGGGGGGGGGQ